MKAKRNSRRCGSFSVCGISAPGKLFSGTFEMRNFRALQPYPWPVVRSGDGAEQICGGNQPSPYDNSNALLSKKKHLLHWNLHEVPHAVEGQCVRGPTFTAALGHSQRLIRVENHGVPVAAGQAFPLIDAVRLILPAVAGHAAAAMLTPSRDPFDGSGGQGLLLPELPAPF